MRGQLVCARMKHEHAARTSTRPHSNGIRAASQRTGGELELVGRLQVGIAGGAVGGGVVLEVEEKGEHLSDALWCGSLGFIPFRNFSIFRVAKKDFLFSVRKAVQK